MVVNETLCSLGKVSSRQCWFGVEREGNIVPRRQTMQTAPAAEIELFLIN